MPNYQTNTSVLRKIYDGTIIAGKSTIYSAKALAKLGIGTFNFLGKHSANFAHSASLATGLNLVFSTALLSSPEEMDRKLSQYSRSYNLDGFANYANETQKMFSNIKTAACLDNQGKKTLDLLKFGAVGDDIKNFVDNNNTQTNKDLVTALQNELQDISADTILHGNAGIEGIFKALSDKISDNSDYFNTPVEIIAAFNNLKTETLQSLKEQKEKSIKKIKNVLLVDLDKNPINLNEHQKAFATLCCGYKEENGVTPENISKLKSKVNELITQVADEYEQAEKAINEYFDGVPAADKDTPAKPGLTEKLAYEKQKAESELYLRILHLERMLMRGFNINDLKPSSGALFSAIIGNQEEDIEEYRKSCLKGVSLAALKEIKWDGKYWGETSVNSLETSNGLTLIYNTKGKDEIEITGIKIPSQLILTDAQWENKVRLAVDQYILALKIDHKPGNKLKLNIEHSVDKNRKMMIIATYHAAIRHGFKPDEIFFTVSGSTDKDANFSEQEATKILSAIGGLNEIDPLKNKSDEERKKLENKDKNKVEDNAFKIAVGALKTNQKNSQTNPSQTEPVYNNSPKK